MRQETDDAVSIAFQVPQHLRATFQYEPGQYLTLRTMVAGHEVRRAYSISSGLDDGEWRVAVKRVEGGLFSAFANETLSVGDIIDVMPPQGRFTLPEPSGPRTIVAFAAGSGITPIAAHIRTILNREADAHVFLFFGNQTARSILFRGAIDDLKDSFMDRLSVHNVLSRESQDIDTLNGRIDAQKVASFMRHVVPFGQVDHILMCGPGAFIEEVRGALQGLGVGDDKILAEHFGTGTGASASAEETASPASAVAAVTLDGVTTEISLMTGETVLDAALRVGLDAPYSCRSGMCSTCRAKISQGKIEMVNNFSLRDEEIAAGFVLTCQAKPLTAHVEIDYDVA
ncbi:MAG: 2Fe-2S iron-sulfur cluster-binding protein [Pseudomonadota bacterium]